jgi:hypothetical protein
VVVNKIGASAGTVHSLGIALVSKKRFKIAVHLQQHRQLMAHEAEYLLILLRNRGAASSNSCE